MYDHENSRVWSLAAATDMSRLGEGNCRNFCFVPVMKGRDCWQRVWQATVEHQLHSYAIDRFRCNSDAGCHALRTNARL